MNSRTKIMKIIGTNGKSTINNNGRKLTRLLCIQQQRIINSCFKHKDIHKFISRAHRTMSIMDYVIANKNCKINKICKTV
jgi:hypothetical protein